MAELVSIAEFNNVNEAYVIKSRLEAEGIRCYLSNENLNSIFGASISFAQVKLQVNLNDSFKAMDILYEEEEGSSETD
jgi:hypothetical protein